MKGVMDSTAEIVTPDSQVRPAPGPVCLFEITEDRQEVVVDLENGRSFKLWYNRATMTPKREREWKAISDQEKSESPILARFLTELVLEWEIKVPPADWPKDQVPTQEDMASWEAYPINQDCLEALPADFLATCVNAISGHIRPNLDSSAS
jgi:hypothetical protein